MALAVVIINPSVPSYSLDDVTDHLSADTPFRCEPTSWTGPYTGTVVPQVLICTPVPITVQLNLDPKYVPREIQEMANEFGSYFPQKSLELFRSATARFEIQSATPDIIDEIEGLGVFRAEATDCDTRSPEIRQVLESLATMVNGWVSDFMHGYFWAPESQTWTKECPD